MMLDRKDCTLWRAQSDEGKLGVTVHTFNLTTWEAEAGGYL